MFRKDVFKNVIKIIQKFITKMFYVKPNLGPKMAPKRGGPRRVREPTFAGLGGPAVLRGSRSPPPEPPKASQTIIFYDLSAIF